MRLKNYLLIFILMASVCLFQAVDSYSARLSGDNGLVSSPQETKEPDQPSNTNNRRRAPGSRNNAADVSPQSSAVSQKGDTSSDIKNDKFFQFNFNDVPIRDMIDFISEQTGINFVLDNNVKGNVTVISQKMLPMDEAYKVFQSVLEINGFTTVPSGSVVKIVPAIEARSKSIETLLADENRDPEDKIVTKIVRLKYASPDELKKIFTAFISKGSIMISYESTGMLIITDVLSNINRIQTIIDAIDIPGTGEEITPIPLKNATADTVSASLNSVFKTIAASGKKTPQTSSQINIVPDERTNSLIIVASEVDTIRIRELVNILDQEIPKGEGDIRVYPLQNADAEELSKTLLAIPQDNKQTAQKGTTPILSQDIQIVPDTATNSLIITAKREEYQVLVDVIEKLDRPRSMVLIEALIMEVSMSKEYELGVQWQGGETGTIGDRSVAVYSSSNSGVDNLPSYSTTSGVTFPSGLSLGVIGDTIEIGGIEFPSIAAVVRAYVTDSDVQILSTPSIMTTDNKAAKINVVDNVPYITRQDQNSSGNDYTNYDFKDVGVMLNITPQINQERVVSLEIQQEVSQILSTDESGQPTTLKRELETTVWVKDGNTIVIGGLIDETENRTKYRVPILSKIPLLGMLFKSKTNSLDKKNLYVFITPHIIENPSEAQKVYEDKKGHIESIQESVIRMYNDTSQPSDMRHVEMGYKYLKLKDYNKAMKYYKKALDKNPDNAYAIYNIGYLYQVQGKTEEAVEMYEKLIAMDPPDRAVSSTDPFHSGKKLTDMAKENINTLKTDK